MFSPSGPWDLVDVGAQAVVAPSEAEFARSVFQLDRGIELCDFAPRDADFSAAPDRACEAADPACALGPVAGAAEDRDDFGHLTGAPFDREVVDVAAAPSVPVEELVVENVQADIDLPGSQFWPTFVRIINGIAASATIPITTR